MKPIMNGISHSANIYRASFIYKILCLTWGIYQCTDRPLVSVLRKLTFSIGQHLILGEYVIKYSENLHEYVFIYVCVHT